MKNLIRLTLLLAVLAALTVAGVWLAGQQGSVTFNLPPAMAGDVASVEVPLVLFAIGLILATMALYWVMKIVSLIIGLPAALRRRGLHQREHQALEAVRDALVALANGDAQAARREARRVQKIAPPSQREVALLLQARAAELAEDQPAARAAYQGLQASASTAFAGAKGLLLQARAAGDMDAACHLARQLHEQYPDKPGTAETLLHLDVARQDWSGALALLPDLQRHGHWTAPALRALKARLLTEVSRQCRHRDDPAGALAHAAEAAALEPYFAPAWQQKTAALLAGQNTDKASAALLRGYRKTRDDSLILAVPRLFRSQPSPVMHRLGVKLARMSQQKPAALYVLALAEDGVGMKAAARARLESLSERWPHREIFHWLAQHAQAEHDQEKAAYWLGKAEAAPPLPAWRCKACGESYPAWLQACRACRAEDALIFMPQSQGAAGGALVAA